MNINILILYYSKNSSTKLLAEAIAKGVESFGARAMLRTVPDIASTQEGFTKQVPDEGAPYITMSELSNIDGMALGSATRFGNMAAPLKYFIDSTSTQWIKGDLIGKPAAVFTSTSSMHGGQESTLISMMIPLLHHGMQIVGIPYSEPALHDTNSGGSPYGATTVQMHHKTPQLSEHEKVLAKALGTRLALTAWQLKQRPKGHK